MKIYQAIEFHSVLLQGGSTKPWLLEVLAEGEVTKRFVVKVFKTKTLEQYNAVAHEVIANELAKLLDLNVPDKAFIDFSEGFIKKLPPTERTLIMTNQMDSRLKFGTVFMDRFSEFSTPSIQHLENYELEDIYAFDNLIFNIDRRPKKPNLLIHTQEYCLIDHELSFEGINDEYTKEVNAGVWNYPKEKHLFYHKLKNRKDKSYVFDDFEMNVRNLKINQFAEIFRTLEKHKHSYLKENFLLQYLRFIQKNISQFKQALKNQIL